MAEKKYAAAVDQGTTGTRFMVFSHDGRVVSSDYLEHEQIYPKPGWVEHNPMEIWEKTQRVIKGSMQKGGIKADEISGIGITNQRETALDWEKKSGKPVYNAVVWQDTRTRDFCQRPVGGVVPVCADLGDQQAALFGQTCYNVGEAKNTYGTGNFMLLNTGSKLVPSKSGLLTTAAYGLEPGKCTYALEGSIAITGAAIQWLRDNLGIIKDAAETEEIAKSVEDSGGIYFVPAFSGLFAPHWDMYARGAIVGLTRYVNRAHLVRATLESICYQTKEVADAMEADSGVKPTTVKVDGGAVKNDFLMQLQADILGVDVIRPIVQETTSLGAAYGAGLATGFWSTLDELRKNWQVDKVFKPKSTAQQRAEGLAGWKKAVQRTLHWVEKEPAKEPVGAGTKA